MKRGKKKRIPNMVGKRVEWSWDVDQKPISLQGEVLEQNLMLLVKMSNGTMQYINANKVQVLAQ